MRTLQQIFDQSLEGLLKQEAFGTDLDRDGCTYLDRESGNRCAIGLVLSIDPSSEDFPDAGALRDIVHSPAVRQDLMGDLSSESDEFRERLDALDDMQLAHDAAFRHAVRGWSPEDLVQRFRKVAVKHGLSTERLEALAVEHCTT